MARAISDGTGGPYDPTGTNASENWVSITVFQEFVITTMSENMTNGVSDQTVNSSALDSSLSGLTNSDIYLQIKRTGDAFVLSDSADGVNWTPEFTNSRPDLHGAAMQVGIEEATYTANSPIIFFADYGVVGTNTIRPPAGDPTNILVSAPVSPTSVMVSWTPAPGSDGSVVVIRENEPIIQSPYFGFSYVGDPTNGAVINMGGEEQALYVGSGTNVTVTGLGGSNNVYNLAVYSYTTNSGTTPFTYDSNPATTNFNGPGTLSSVSFVTAPSAIPVDGVGLAVVTACYTSGDCYNVSSSPNITLSSDNPSVLQISGEVMEGLTNGTANVTATYAGISGTNVVTVHSPVFTDNFSDPHDYITNGLLGTSWDGEYLNFGDVPGAQEYAGALAGETTVLNADISNTNILSLEAAGSSWEGVGDDGPFLFKIVTGDFQASVHITTMNNINFNAAGLMARLFDNSGSPTQGAAGGNGGETHVNWWKVQAGALSVRYTLDGNPPTDQPGLNATDTWLLLQRFDSTNFYCYEAATNNGGVWNLAATIVVPEAANNAPMEVGVAEEMDTASDGTVQFDTFMLDGVGIVSPTGVQPPPPASGLTMTLNNDLSLTLDWTAESNGVPIQSMVVMRAGAPVSAQPPYGYLFDDGPQPFGVGSYLGDGNWVVYRSPNPPASVTNSTVVTGLTPGTTYYAAVYTWVGSSTAKVFDEVIPPTGSSGVELDGVLTNVIVLPPPSIPAGGIGQLQVLGYYQGGAVVNVSQFADLSSGDTNIVDTADGVITGYTNGTGTVTATYSGFTNTVNVVVRTPTYSDNFTTPHDYLSNGVAGTFFDGVYTNFGDIPEQDAAGAGNNASDATLALDAGITSPGLLTITNFGGGWEFNSDDGTFLFKYVPGDFQMSIHINNYSDTINYTIPSIMARAYSVSTNGGAPNTGATVGAPLDGLYLGPPPPDTGECYVRMARFDEYGIGTYPEITIDNQSDQATQPGQGDGQNWLLLVRQNYTNFNVYQRLTNNQPWHLTPNKTSFSNAKFAGVPMQVGITLSTFNAGVASYVQFDSFMLDAALEGNPLQVSSAAGFITITWNDYPGAVLQSSPSLDPATANWQPVGTAPTYGNGVASVTLAVPSTGNLFFRLSQTAP
jgi:regulation of enolase protein 1 (concanavalin A-like superfamily)